MRAPIAGPHFMGVAYAAAVLRYRADLRPLAFHVTYFASLGAAMMWAPLGGWAAPLFAALCATAFLGAVQTHNAVHAPVFTRRAWNKAYQVVLTLIYGHPVSSYVPGHNLSHHKHTQTRRDVMRTTKARFRWNFLNGALFFFIVAPSIMRADATYVSAARRRHRRWFHQLVLEFSMLVAVTGGLLYFDWRKTLIFWVLPHVYAQWGIVTMNLLQHDGCDGQSRYNHSRNFVNRSFNWWVLNNGFHGIHHEHPGVHWSLLPELHQREYGPHLHPALEQESIVAYLWHTFFLNHRETYAGAPFVLPEEGPDQWWIPPPEDTRGDLGAEGVDP
ncbi:MAG: fatty acid desaturase [Nannocystaceae bacterium]